MSNNISKYKERFIIELFLKTFKIIICFIISIICVEYGSLFLNSKSIFILFVFIINFGFGAFWYLSIKKSNKILYNYYKKIYSIRKRSYYEY